MGRMVHTVYPKNPPPIHSSEHIKIVKYNLNTVQVHIYIFMYTVYTVYRDLRFLSFISQVNGEETGETLSAYCSSPETVFGAAYLAILPSHRLLRGSSSVRLVLEKAFQAGRGECFLFHTDRSIRQHVCVTFLKRQRKQNTNAFRFEPIS